VSDDVLLRWLAGIGRERLAALLRGRPGLLGLGQSGPVGSLTDLARRLTDPASASEALAGMPTPVLQVAEAAAVLGPQPVPVVTLAALLGRTPDDPDLEEALARLEQIGVLLLVDDSLVAPADLRSVFRAPLRLGPPMAEVLRSLSAAQLAAIARGVGVVHSKRSRADLLAVLIKFFVDPAEVRALVAHAPEKTRLLLEEMAARGVHPPYGVLIDSYSAATRDAGWAEERALLSRDHGWGYALEMPAEVGLALRGPGYHAPFSPEPPFVPTVQIPVELAEREAGAALSAAVERVCAVVAECDQQPIALLKAGGVGVREVRRLAKRLGVAEQQARLWLELAGELGLISAADFEESEALVTEEFDDFRGLSPAEQADRILHAWLATGSLPTWVPPEGKQEPPLSYFAGGPLPALRLTVLSVAGQVLTDDAGVPRGASDFDAVQAVIRWFAPVISGDLADGVIDSIWAEAQLLGLIAHAAPTSLGMAIMELTAPECPLRVAAARLVSPASKAGIFQADLTVVVPGSPAATLSDLLDSAADREGRGVASLWRFSAGSIRRALDAGSSAEELERALAGASQSGELPQPLRYLIGDVARRHGAVRVRAAGCVIRSADTALLAEMAATARLRELELWQPAPELLISTASAEETLNRLRAAGFAPVEEGARGEVVVTRPVTRRAAVPDPAELESFEMPEIELAGMGLADPDELAEQLLTQPPAGRREDRRRRPAPPSRAQLEEINYLERLFKME
jgi:hypothetical protein